MSPDGSTILFRSAPSGLDRKRLRLFQAKLTTLLTAGRTFNCLLASDAELRRLNSTFLGHDYPTDVLSFPSLPGEESLGEVAISAVRAVIAFDWSDNDADAVESVNHLRRVVWDWDRS